MSVFEGFIGQDDIKARLRDFLNDLSGHAFIFEGPEGIGRHSFAKEFARALLCTSVSEDKPCGICRSCACFREGSHPDYAELLPDKNSAVIKTDSVRKILVGDIRMMPQLSGRKVYFISADHLNEQSQNVILKTLEEPPEYAVIILSVTSAGVLLPTVFSRAITLKFKRYSPDEVMKIISSKGYDTDSSASFFAGISDGIPGKALRMLQEEGLGELRNRTAEITASLPGSDHKSVFLDLYPFFYENKDSIDDIMLFMTSWFRDTALLCDDSSSGFIVNPDLKDMMSRFCERTGSRAVKYMRCVEICDKSAAEIEKNAAFEINICSMLLRLRKELIN